MSRRVRRCNDGAKHDRGGWAYNYKFKPLALNEVQTDADMVFLFSIGELLEGIAAGRARAGIEALIAMVPRTALRQKGASFELETVPLEELAVGDKVVVRAGDRVPSDGIIL